jgi:hypothetical protein
MGDGRYWFGLAGVITARKNPGLVMDAVALLPEKAGLLVAGVVEASARGEFAAGAARLAAAGIPLVHHDRTMSNAEMNAAIEAMDCVVVAYDTHAPPSTMGKSYVLGTDCILAGSEQLREHARYLGHARTCEPTVEALSGVMVQTIAAQQRLGPRGAPVTDRFACRLVSSN